MERLASERRPYNWGLLLIIVMAVEFWIVAATVVAQHI
jgi:hypothetical protein